MVVGRRLGPDQDRPQQDEVAEPGVDDVAVNGPNHEGYAPLKAAIAERYNVAPENVVASQGTSMANFLAMATIIERGDEVLIEEPTYDPFLGAAEYLGANVKRFSRKFENGFQLDLDELKSLLTPKTKLIVISNPHNPSGVTCALDDLRALALDIAPVPLFVDEAYADFSGRADRESR